MKTKAIIKLLRRFDSTFDEDIQLANAAANRLELLSAQMKKLHARIAILKEERDELLKTLRFHGGCDFCKHERLDWDEAPCLNCRGTGGTFDKWEWRGAKDTNVPSKSATDINVGSKEE